MSKMGLFAVGWLAGVASVVTAAIVADTARQSNVVFGGGDTVKEVDGGASLRLEGK